MSEKRKAQGDDNARKKKYRSDGTPIWGKRHIEGPGVWVSCVKGKEKQAVGEILEVFESIASELWPKVDEDAEDEDTELGIEDQIAKELSVMKRPRAQNVNQRFADCQTNTPCVIFISCKPPVDPVDLVLKHVKMVEETGVTRTRNIHRIVPVSGSSVANVLEIQALCKRVFSDFFDRHPDTKFTYKIELRVRNHNTIPRQTMIQTVAECVPDVHTVDLQDPKLFILIEVFKSICGVSVVEDYYHWHKFNVMEIANEKKKSESKSESRLGPRDNGTHGEKS